ncbi:unnamed protein product, partial [Allacma fusca]
DRTGISHTVTTDADQNDYTEHNATVIAGGSKEICCCRPLAAQDSLDYKLTNSSTLVIYAIGPSDNIDASHGDGFNRGNFAPMNFFTGS